MPANPVEATKWHLISRARSETDIMLDEFVSKLDAETRAAGGPVVKGAYAGQIQAGKISRRQGGIHRQKRIATPVGWEQAVNLGS